MLWGLPRTSRPLAHACNHYIAEHAAAQRRAGGRGVYPGNAASRLRDIDEMIVDSDYIWDRNQGSYVLPRSRRSLRHECRITLAHDSLPRVASRLFTRSHVHSGATRAPMLQLLQPFALLSTSVRIFLVLSGELGW